MVLKRFLLILLSSILLAGCQLPPTVYVPTASPAIESSVPETQPILTPASTVIQTISPMPTSIVAPLIVPTSTAEAFSVTLAASQPEPTITPIFLSRAAESTMETIDQLWDWQQVGPRSRHWGFLYNGKDLVWIEGWNKKGEPPGQNFTGTQLFTQRNGRQTLWLTTEGTYLIEPMADQGFLAVTEIQNFGPPQRLYLFRLETGERKVIDQREGKFSAPDFFIPNRILLEGGRLIWNAARPDRHTCLRLYDWETRTTRELFCSEQAEEILQPFALKGTTLTYGVLRFAPFQAELYERELPGTEDKLPEARHLFGIEGNAEYLISDGQVTALLGPYLETVMAMDLYAGGMNGAIQRLDYSDNNMNVCSGYVFWPNNEQGEVRAWKPGGPIQVVFRGGDNFPFSCSDGWVTFNHFGAENPDENGIYAVKVP